MEKLSGKSTSGVIWTYDGDVLNGTAHGNGTLTLSERSEKYVGQFLDGNFFHGEWTLTYFNGMSSRHDKWTHVFYIMSEETTEP